MKVVNNKMVVCEKCSLPKEICACETIAREEERIQVFTIKRRYGKIITIINGIHTNGKQLLKEMKRKLACGGTFKGNEIELQGDHKNRVKDILIKQGFQEDQIEVN